MKKMLNFIFIFIAINGFYIQVDANSGPPENVSVTILNINENYELDIFIPLDRTLNEADYIEAQTRISNLEDSYEGMYYQETYPSFLVDFQDKDGYVSNTLYGKSDYFYRFNENQFRLYMNVPRVFRIVLIHQEQLIISKTIEMQAYDERFIWDLEGVEFSNDISYDAGVFEGLNDNPFFEMRPYQELLIRVIVTLIIELFIFYLLGYRHQRTFIFYGILNIITQILLTFGLLYGSFLGFGIFYGFVLLLIGEVLVFGSEMGINGLIIKEKYTSHIVFSTFLANLASLIIGTIIAIQLNALLW
jgi:hypothetical protein